MSDVAVPNPVAVSSDPNRVLAAQRHERSLAGPVRGLWVLLAVVLSVKAILLPTRHTTYPCFEAGSRCWWAEKNMYDFHECGYEYRYSPTFAVAFSPLAAFPTAMGGVLWGLLNVGLLWWALREFTGSLAPGIGGRNMELVFVLLALLGSIRGFWSAQSNTLVIAFVMAGAAALARRELWKAAFLLAIPVFIKVWPLAVVMLLAACWPRQLLWRCTAAHAALSALPFLTRPPGVVLWQYHNWYSAVTRQIHVRHDYRDVWTLWEWLAPPVSPQGYLALQLVSASAVLGLCLWQQRRAPTLQHALTFVLGIWTAWQLALGPGTERNTFCLIAPLTAWGLLASWRDHSETWPRRLLMLGGFGLIALFTFGIFERKLVDRFPGAIAALPIGVLMFSLWLILHARRWRAPSS